MRSNLTQSSGQTLPPATKKLVAREIALLLKRNPSLNGVALQDALAKRGIMHGPHKISRGNISSILRELKSSRPAMPSRPQSSTAKPVARGKPVAPTRQPKPRRGVQSRVRDVVQARKAATGTKPSNEMYPWQSAAIRAWEKAGHRGVVQAITGSGKTRVGLEAAEAAIANGQGVVVVVPSKLLKDQWSKVASWLPQSTRPEPGFLSVTTASAASKAKYWEISQMPRDEFLIIVDEVHRMGSDVWSNALVSQATNRLGLTATLERSDGGVELRVAPYFGLKITKEGAVPTFNLDYKRAREESTISRYQVVFVPCVFSTEESERYQRLKKAYSNSWAELHAMTAGPGRPPRNASATQKLKWAARYYPGNEGPLFFAARSVIKSFNGLNKLMSNMTAKQDFVASLANAGGFRAKSTIFFSQQIETMEAIQEHLKRAKVNAVAISGESTDDERVDAVQRFHDGKVEVFLSPRVADEGLDLPGANLAISIASVKSRRHLIQRLGRVIRPKKDDSLATLLVLFAVDTLEDPDQGGASHFRMLASQGGIVELIPADISPAAVLKQVLKALRN